MEMTQLVQRNGRFVIERMEITYPLPGVDDLISGQTWTMHVRAGLEGIISKHFGAEIIDDLFDRFNKKYEYCSLLKSKYKELTQLFIALKRI